jgi:hypothetical protein
VNSLTREQRMYAAAGASILFIISLFFNWYDVGGTNVSFSGQDIVPSWWLLLIFAAAAAAILIGDINRFQMPSFIQPAAWPAYLMSICFIVSLMFFLDPPVSGLGRQFGVFLAVLFSLVAAVLTTMHWREESK